MRLALCLALLPLAALAVITVEVAPVGKSIYRLEVVDDVGKQTQYIDCVVNDSDDPDTVEAKLQRAIEAAKTVLPTRTPTPALTSTPTPKEEPTPK